MAAKEFNDRYYELLNKNADGKEFASLLKEVLHIIRTMKN